eukprot:g1623.t1
MQQQRKRQRLKCRTTANCAFFWVYTAGKDAGKCFPKSAITGPVRKPACTTCGGVFFKMDGEPSTTGGMTFDSWDTPVVAMQGDTADQLYSQITFPFYDVFLGIVMVFDAESKAGHVHCRLSWSPDGLSSWSWVDAGGLKGAEFIPAGRPGEFDSNVCFAAHLPVRMEDGSSRLYFMGGNGPHSGARNSSFGLATARPDRFAGVSGSGYSVTKPLTVTGATILLTADILAPGGSVTVGVVGQGAGLAQATPLAQNATDHAVRFPSAPSGLQPLVGKQVRLSITAKDAAVYTVGFRYKSWKAAWQRKFNWENNTMFWQFGSPSKARSATSSVDSLGSLPSMASGTAPSDEKETVHRKQVRDLLHGRRGWLRTFREGILEDSSSSPAEWTNGSPPPRTVTLTMEWTEVCEEDGSGSDEPNVPCCIRDPFVPPPNERRLHELESVMDSTFLHKFFWFRQQCHELMVPLQQGHERVTVLRATILDDSFIRVMALAPAAMRKDFRFEFIGEYAHESAAREWFELVSRQLFNVDNGLFQFTPNDAMTYTINPQSQAVNDEHLNWFHFAGRVVGKALLDGQTVSSFLALPYIKHLNGTPIVLGDLQYVDERLYNDLRQLLSMPSKEVETMALDFTVTREGLGMHWDVDLKPGGADIPVTRDNVIEYAELRLRERFYQSSRLQLAHLLRGIYEVVPQSLLAAFTYQELEILLIGQPNIDVGDWRAHTEYSGDYSDSHELIGWFWAIVEDYSEEDRAKLLQFTTGTCRVPAQGFQAMQSHDNQLQLFCIHVDKRQFPLPRGHACFNRIDLPVYQTRQELRTGLDTAIHGLAIEAHCGWT